MAAKNPDILVANPDIRYPDIRIYPLILWIMAAKNPDILMIDSYYVMYIVYIFYSVWCWWFSLILEF